MYGWMEEFMRENGLIIKCMGKGCINGKMEGVMKVSIVMIKRVVMVYIHGLMGGSMLDFGRMVRDRGKEGISWHQGQVGKGYGIKIKE
jgi:hypothetical protein